MSLAQQIARINWIDAQIRAGRYPNAKSVSAHFRVSTRTAYDDRNRLIIDLKAPIEHDSKANGWYYTDPGYELPFMGLPEAEASSLRRLLLAAQEYLDPDDALLVECLFIRLAPDLPQHSLPFSCSGSMPISDPNSISISMTTGESVGGALHLARSASVAPELLTRCRQAIQNRQRLEMDYYSPYADETTHRIVHPYHLHNFRGEHHLIAWCELRNEIRQFFLGRVRKYHFLPEEGAFEVKPVDVESYLRRGLGAQHGEEPKRVRIRFSEYQARWIRERQYHASQEVEELPCGGLILTLRVSGLAEVARWVLSYGSHAEVLEPEALRREVAQHAKNLAKIYTGE